MIKQPLSPKDIVDLDEVLKYNFVLKETCNKILKGCDTGALIHRISYYEVENLRSAPSDYKSLFDKTSELAKDATFKAIKNLSRLIFNKNPEAIRLPNFKFYDALDSAAYLYLYYSDWVPEEFNSDCFSIKGSHTYKRPSGPTICLSSENLGHHTIIEEDSHFLFWDLERENSNKKKKINPFDFLKKNREDKEKDVIEILSKLIIEESKPAFIHNLCGLNEEDTVMDNSDTFIFLNDLYNTMIHKGMGNLFLKMQENEEKFNSSFSNLFGCPLSEAYHYFGDFLGRELFNLGKGYEEILKNMMDTNLSHKERLENLITLCQENKSGKYLETPLGLIKL